MAKSAPETAADRSATVDRNATLTLAIARRQRLQAMFDDASFVDMALRQGRYLRLCAAIAWASEREERARAAMLTDGMVEGLRRVSRGARVA
ncbi:MAG: hypothetical protein ACK5JM_00175 [Rhodoblastus sp.]